MCMLVEHEFMGELVEMARSCACSAELRQWTLTRVVALLPCDSAIYLSPCLHEAPSSVNKEEFRHLYWNYARNPERYSRGLAKGVLAAQTLGGAYIDTEVFSASERSDLPLYAEMLRPQGIHCQIVARPLFHAQSAGLIYLCRHGIGRFRRHHLDQMLRLLPIIALSHIAIDSLAKPRVDSDAAGPVDHMLTRREREVVELVCRGLTNGEVATALGTSVNTIRNQLAAIFRKLEVASRAELAGLVRSAQRGHGA